MKRKFIYFLLISSFLMVNCNPVHRVTKTNLAYIYYNDPTVIHPAYKVYHINDSLSRLYVRVKSSEILYSKNNPQKIFKGKMVFNVQLYGLEHKRLLSTDTVHLEENTGPAENKYLLGSLDIYLPFGEKYLAEVTFDDQYRMQYVQDIVFVDKSNEFSEENYLITNEAGEVQFGNVFEPGAKLNVESSQSLPKELKFKAYEPFGALPPPPFVIQESNEINFTGEQEIQVKTTNSHHFEIELGEAGIYHLSNPLAGVTSLTFLVFHAYYPYVKTVSSMVGPMRYITTKQEYEQFMNSENLKKEIDDFWLKMAGNAERASENIREFFSRVELANKHFTSYTQGWKTDRGLIYIIYGQPTSITRNENTENWLYTEKTNVMSAEFNFLKVGNEYSNNDYILNRSTGYKSGWYRSIDSWRQGKVYK